MNSPSALPAWLLDTLSQRRSQADAQYREEEPIEVLPGDVLVVGPFDDYSAGGSLLIAVDSENGWFKGMLANAQTELATEVDAILPPASTGLGYEITAHTRFHGPLWTVQVRRRVGAIEMSTLEQLEKLAWRDEPSGVTLRRGQPLQPEGLDPRFPVLRALSLEFDLLTDNFRRRCHDLMPVLDPLVGELDTLNELLCESGWEDQIKAASISAEFNNRFLDTYPQLSPDQQRAVQLIAEHTQRGRSSRQSVLKEDLDIPGHKDKGALVVGIGQVQGILPFLEVLTHPECWERKIPASAYADIDSERVLIGFTSLGDKSMQKMA
ncbi:MAG: hypothetical protein KTV68_05540 [Acidimicrobiia bacterium]|nr:hypothetical protein [Acidimicrobiia bacterium]MCY4433396.1 hypothetical protein [bacterium]